MQKLFYNPFAINLYCVCIYLGQLKLLKLRKKDVQLDCHLCNEMHSDYHLFDFILF